MTDAGGGDVERQRLAAELRQRGRGRFEKFRTALHFAGGDADRFANILADQRGDLFAGAEQRSGGVAQPGDALVRRLLAVGGEGRCRRHHGAVHTGLSRFRDPADDAIVLRGDQIESLAAGRGRCAIDEVGENRKG